MSERAPLAGRRFGRSSGGPGPGAPGARGAALSDDQSGWGWSDVFLAVLAGYLGAAVVGVAVTSAGGWKLQSEVPGWALLIIQLPLWAAMFGVPWWASHTKGRGIVVDFGFAVRWIDLPIGIAVGVAAQLLIYELYRPFGSHVSAKELSKPARQLADQFGPSVVGKALLVVMVSIMAPLTEEMLYRGLLMRTIERRWPRWVAVVGSGLVFGLMHFERWQTIGLAAFGMLIALLVMRTGRLGTSMIAHAAFNTVAVVQIFASGQALLVHH